MATKHHSPVPSRKPDFLKWSEGVSSPAEWGEGKKSLDLQELKTLIANPEINRQKLESTIDTIKNPAEKKSLSDALRAELAQANFSSESSRNETLLAQAFVRLEDGASVSLDGVCSDALYERYSQIRTLRVGEKAAESLNANELLDTAVRQILKRNVALLDRPEGIPLGIDRIYAETIATLGDIDAALPADHPLKGSSKPLIENFLNPANDGKRLIRFAIDRAFPSDKPPEAATEKGRLFDIGVIAIRGSIGTLLDFARSDDPSVASRMRETITRLEQDPDIRAVTDRFPDFLDFFRSAPPASLRALDKNKTMAGLDQFFGECRDDFLTFTNNPDAERAQVATLHIVNSGAKFLRSVVTDENASALVVDISRLSAVKTNPMFADLIMLVRDEPSISNADRWNVARRILEGIERFTEKKIDEKGAIDYFDAILRDIVSLRGKIPTEKLERALANIIKPLMESKGTTQGGGSNLELSLMNDPAETLKTAFANLGVLASATSFYFQGKSFDSVESVVRFVLENKILETNIEAAGWALATRLQKMLSGDIAVEIERMRTSILKSLPRQIELPTKEKDTSKASFEERLAGGIVSDIGGLIQAKVNGGAVENGGNLTRAELIRTGIDSVRNFLRNNQTEAIDFLRAAGAVIRPWDEAAFGNFVDGILAHPKFAAIAERVAANAGSRLAKATDYAGEIKSIVAELATKWADSKLIGPEVRREGLRLSVDTLYDTIIRDPETAKKLLGSIGLDRIGSLSQADILKAASLFVRTIPKDKVIAALSPLAEKGFEKMNISDLLSAGTGLLKSLSKESVDSLVDELRKQGILAKTLAGNTQKPSGKVPVLGARDIAEGVRLLYTFCGKVDTETLGGLSQDVAGPIGKILWPGLDLALRDIPMETMARKLAAPESLRLINQAAAGRLDMGDVRTQEQISSLAADLYESIPDAKRAEFLRKLSESGIISQAMTLAPKTAKKSSEKPLAVSEPMIDHLSRLAYGTLSGFSGGRAGADFATRFRELAAQAMPWADIGKLLSIPVMGATLGENIHTVLNCIPQAEFSRILKANKDGLNTVLASGNPDLATKIGTDMALAVDAKKFRAAIAGRKLSGTEQLAVNYIDTFQQTVRNTPDFAGFVREGRAVAETLSRNEAPSADALSKFSGRLFDFASDLMQHSPDLAAAALASGWEGWSGSGDLPIVPMLLSFLRNNFGFVFSNLFSCLFDQPKALQSYFADTSNRSNFAETLWECTNTYVSSRKKK